jgi:hypothetical protein
MIEIINQFLTSLATDSGLNYEYGEIYDIPITGLAHTYPLLYWEHPITYQYLIPQNGYSNVQFTLLLLDQVNIDDLNYLTKLMDMDTLLAKVISYLNQYCKVNHYKIDNLNVLSIKNYEVNNSTGFRIEITLLLKNDTTNCNPLW